MEQRLSPSFTPWAKHVDDLSFAFFFFFLVDSLPAYMQKHRQRRSLGRFRDSVCVLLLAWWDAER